VRFEFLAWKRVAYPQATSWLPDTVRPIGQEAKPLAASWSRMQQMLLSPHFARCCNSLFHFFRGYRSLPWTAEAKYEYLLAFQKK
jgi:hypothetical protein